jgi:uncharacterized membrane protein YdjX (TVP38/TMEM64 family)
MFVATYVVAVLMLLPAWPFAVAAGMWFGLAKGLVVCTLAANMASMLAFVIARRLSGWVVNRLARYSYWPMCEQLLRLGNWRVVILLRLSPVIPYNVQNYIYGLTPIGFWSCTWATFVAMLPGTFVYVYLGYAGRWSLTGSAGARSWGEWLLLGLGLAATIALVAYLTYLARLLLRQQIATSPPSIGSTKAAGSPITPTQVD